MNKTYKREFAAFMVITTMACFVAGFWHPYFKEVAELLLVPSFTMSGAAFGLDAFAKQVKK
ncbi:hypothetical protein [Tritonibacter mobilis]|uniref:hypothetical protein n=1 Tax=Tritonibacter mobilis TaxID=379347 RepID=UPI000806C916|nr:hypothetical protein [Tritonibacter mobilis]